MNKNKILSNLIILGSGRVVTMLISALGTVVSARYLGPTKVGELAFAGAIIGLLGQVNAMGMETFLIRAIARDPKRSGKLVATSLLLRFLLALPVPVVLAVYIAVAHISREVATISYLLALSMILWSLTVVFIWMLQALEEMTFVAASDVLVKLGGLIFAGLIILLHGNVVAFALAAPVNGLLLFILTLWYVRSHVRLDWRIGWDNVREVIQGSIAFWAKDVTMTVYTYIDSVILASLSGVRAVGFYSPPTRIFAVGLAVPNIVGNATFPLLSRLGIDTQHDFARVGRKTLAFLVLTGMPLVVGLATFARPIIVILFGPAFEPSVPVLIILSVCLLPMFLNSQFAFILTGRDQQWRWTWIMMLSGGVNVVMNIMLIPFAIHVWHNAAVGAAAALLGTEMLMVFYGAVILRDVILDTSLARSVVGALVAGTIQVGIVLLMGSEPLHLIAGEIFGLSVYAFMVVALGAVPRRDVLVLWETAQRGIGHHAAEAI